jgi:hypothetical protein
MTTGRANEAARPSQPFQVVQAVCISREPSLKFPKRLRVVDAGMGTFHCPSLRSTPVKWIPQTGVIVMFEIAVVTPHLGIVVLLGPVVVVKTREGDP